MTVVAALSGPLPKAGVIVLAGLVAGALLSAHPRARAGAMLGALVLAPILLLAEIWNSQQVSVLHRHPALAVASAVVALAGLAALAALLVRRRWLIAPLTVAALPFRIPIQAGGTTSNLLVPLYVVIAAGALAWVADELRAQIAGAARRTHQPAGSTDGGGPGTPAARVPAPVKWLTWLLAGYVVLYAVQALYSADFEKALQQMVFFYAPFGLLFCQLRALRWNHRLLRACLQLAAVLAVVFAVIGFIEYATKTIIFNPKLVMQNDLHAYFTVNSVFFDPDIFGRFLALVMIALAAALLYARRRGEQLLVTGALAVLWAGLVLTLSRSSLGALLLGLGTLVALRWRPRLTLATAAVVIAAGAVAVAVHPTTFGLNQGLNGASAGRAGLISGGVHMFAQRPVFGYGSGSFVTQYRRENPGASTLAASHTIAVTIAAEQGLIGELVYAALVLVALVALLQGGARGDPARAAIAAAFIALIFHTNLYADFLEDPLTWTVLGIGVALATAATVSTEAERPTARAATTAAAVAS